MRHALINLKTGLVENVVEIEDGDGSKAEDGYVLRQDNKADIGDGWDGKKIVPQPRPEPTVIARPAHPETKEAIRAALDDISARLAALESKS